VSLHGATAFEGGAPKHATAVTDGPRAITVALAFGRGAPDGAATEPAPQAAHAPRALDDPLVRRAIGAAIDRERLRRLAVREPAVVAAGLAPGLTLPRLDAARARAVIARATAAGRMRAGLMIDASRESDRDLADKLLADLADDGIDLTVDAVEPRAFADRLAAGRYDLALVEAGGGPADQPALAALALIAAVDPQLARALLARAADPAAAARAVDERALLAPLFHRAVRAHHRADLRGLTIDPLGRLDFASVWIAPRSPSP
jgi:MarR-like DNA-binding transcriptional regulator SgrR of sgrS sRNA